MQHPSPLNGVLSSVLLCLGVLSYPLSSNLAAQRGYHTDARVGFKFKLPPNWSRFPVEKDRRFVTGHYVSTKSWPVTGSSDEHRPVLRVVVLPKGEVLAASAEPSETVEFYADYEDYLRRNLSGEIVFERRADAQVSGLDCVQHEIRREIVRDKKVRKYSLTTWVFDVDRWNVAVEFFVLAEHANKLRRQFTSCFKSLRRVPVDKDLASSDPWRPPLWLREPDRWKALALGERLRLRAIHESEVLAAVRKNVVRGFNVKESKHCLILSRSNSKYTGEIARAADACVIWCQEHLEGVSDEAVTKAVIRIFDDWGDYGRYRTRSSQSSRYVPAIREIILTPGRRLPKELTGVGDLTQGILHHFLYEKAPGLYRNLPRWIHDGLLSYMRLSKLAGSRLLFEPSDYERKVVRDGKRSGRLERVEAVISHTTARPEGRRGWRRLRQERGRVVRFLIDGTAPSRGVNVQPVAPNPATAGFLIAYLRAVREQQRDHGVPARSPGAGRVPGSTEESREKRADERDVARKKLRERVNLAVCNWGDAQWAIVERAYDKFNQKL